MLISFAGSAQVHTVALICTSMRSCARRQSEVLGWCWGEPDKIMPVQAVAMCTAMHPIIITSHICHTSTGGHRYGHGSISATVGCRRAHLSAAVYTFSHWGPASLMHLSTSSRASRIALHLRRRVDPAPCCWAGDSAPNSCLSAKAAMAGYMLRHNRVQMMSAAPSDAGPMTYHTILAC